MLEKCVVIVPFIALLDDLERRFNSKECERWNGEKRTTNASILLVQVEKVNDQLLSILTRDKVTIYFDEIHTDLKKMTLGRKVIQVQSKIVFLTALPFVQT